MQREKLFFYSVCLVAFLIPFDIKITNSIVLISFALWLLSARENLRANWPVFNTYFFLFASLYLINIPGLIHTDNLSGGFGRLESRLSYLAFPLMIFFSMIDRQQFRMIGYSFCLGVFLAGLYCLAVSLNTVLHTDPAGRYFGQVSYLLLLEALELHPTYFSIFVSFSTFFLLNEFFTSLKGSRKRWLLILPIASLTGLNFLIQSRAPLASFLLILIIGVAFMVFTLKNTFQKRIAFAAIVLLLAGVLVNYKKVLTRFDMPFREISEMVLKPDKQADQVTLSTIFHLRSWYCSVLLLSDYHMLTGYGSGDEKDVLQPCYEKRGWMNMASERQNAHNEYLSALLRMGILEFSLLLCCLLIPCYLSIKHRHFLYTAFLLLWMASFFFTTLNLQSAMFFYTLFNALFFRTLIMETTTPAIAFQTTKDTLPVVS
jgi:O-antigen ligase